MFIYYIHTQKVECYSAIKNEILLVRKWIEVDIMLR
jgi:hypothetical protein